jgi:hypothetical protein
MDQLTESLLHRLENRGFEAVAIPRFVKDVASTLSINHHIDLQEMNRRLNLLGWGPVELDYHTFQMIIASLETGGLTREVNRPSSRFEKTLVRSHRI